MPFVSRDLLRVSLEELNQSYSPLLIVSVPCMLASKVPICSSPKEAGAKAVPFGVREEREWLETYFAIRGNPPGKPFFMPGTGAWVEERYPDRALQRRRKDFEGTIFFPTRQGEVGDREKCGLAAPEARPRQEEVSPARCVDGVDVAISRNPRHQVCDSGIRRSDRLQNSRATGNRLHRCRVLGPASRLGTANRSRCRRPSRRDNSGSRRAAGSIPLSRRSRRLSRSSTWFCRRVSSTGSLEDGWLAISWCW